MKNWKRVFDLANEFYNLSPWNWMEETDIFGIKVPGEEDIHFASVMGSAKIHPSVAFYQGWPGLAKYWELQDVETHLGPDILLTTPHLLLSFSDWEGIEFSQRKIFRLLNYRPVNKNSWPEIKRIVPGFFPVSIDESETVKIAAILEQTLEVVKRAKHNKAFIHGEMHSDNTYLVRELLINGDSMNWKDQYRDIELKAVKYASTYNTGKLQQVLSFPAKTTMELDLRIMPIPVKEKNKPAYFSFILICTETKYGLILGTRTLTPFPRLDDLYNSLPAEFLELLIGAKISPAVVYVRNDLLYRLIQTCFEKHGMVIKLVEDLPQSDAAVKGLIGHLK
ncbi:MAG: hypothetical protein NTU44_07430 [Bacteroidetes bacterium]|nr:hypothetical protein [Bacteroidota bacterium]